MEADKIGILFYILLLVIMALVILSSWLKDDLEKAIGSGINISDILKILKNLDLARPFLLCSFQSSFFFKKELEAQKKINQIILGTFSRINDWPEFENNIIKIIYNNQLFKNFDQNHNFGRWREEIEEKFSFLCIENIQDPFLLSEKINLIDEGNTKSNWQELISEANSVSEYQTVLSS